MNIMKTVAVWLRNHCDKQVISRFIHLLIPWCVCSLSVDSVPAALCFLLIFSTSHAGVPSLIECLNCRINVAVHGHGIGDADPLAERPVRHFPRHRPVGVPPYAQSHPHILVVHAKNHAAVRALKLSFRFPRRSLSQRVPSNYWPLL
jgi:hypothetical protein